MIDEKGSGMFVIHFSRPLILSCVMAADAKRIETNRANHGRQSAGRQSKVAAINQTFPNVPSSTDWADWDGKWLICLPSEHESTSAANVVD